MKIYIVEDDRPIANLIRLNLQLEGYQTEIFADGQLALTAIEEEIPDLILLDIMLPGINGFEIQSRIKEKNIPVIFLTARINLNDKLLGLELGADDYITKPFDNRELILRIKAVLKRVKPQYDPNDEILFGDFRLLISQRCFFIKDQLIDLTPTEFDLMRLLIENKKIVFSREQLLKSLRNLDSWGDSRTVDMHIQRLRKKLGDYRDVIKSIYGVGYKLDVAAHEDDD
jgi:DNA-binding response OmpR family regulator